MFLFEQIPLQQGQVCMKSFLLSACFMLFAAGQAVSQDGSEGDMGVKTTIEALPSLNAALSIGFNYDFIKQPTDVSFEYPRGYFGLNIPFRQNLPILDIAKGIEPSLDSILSDSTLIRDGNEFKPTASAKQNANTTVRVDVPMLGGVATFSNMQNFYLSYMNVLGNPSFYIAPDSAMDGLSFAMRGAVDVPLEMSLSWETMTFGYAYRVNPNIIFAFNLHRHLFVLDVAAQVNVDILGAFRFEPVVAGGGADVGGISVEGEINYNAERTRGVARAHYKAET